MKGWTHSSNIASISLRYTSTSEFPSGFALGKTLGAALPAFDKPCPSLLFHLVTQYGLVRQPYYCVEANQVSIS